MTRHRTGRLIGILYLLVAGAGLAPGAAQQDDALLTEAAARTRQASSFQFDFDLLLMLSGIPQGDALVNLRGEGAVTDLETTPALSLVTDGGLTIGGRHTPAILQARVVDGIAYFNRQERWSGTPLSELVPLVQDVIVSSFRAGFAGASEAAVLTHSAADPLTREALDALRLSLNNLDLIGFTETVRHEDEPVNDRPTARYTSTVDVAALVRSDAGQNVIVGLLQLGDPASPQALSGAERNALSALIAQLFDQTTLTVERYVGLDDGYLHRVVVELAMTVDTARAGASGLPLTLNLNLDLRLSNFGGVPAIQAPENAMVIAGLANVVSVPGVITAPTARAPEPATLTPVPRVILSIAPNTPTTIALSGAAPTDLRYSAASGETVSIVVRSLEEPGALDTTVELLTSNAIRLNYNDDQATVRDDLLSTDSAIEGQALEAGDYIIRVNSFTGTAQGSAEVTVERIVP